MHSENNAVRHYTNGFDLTEKEFRHFTKIITEQISKTTGKYEIDFEVKFYSGVVSHFKTADEVLALSNGGSDEITQIKIEAKDFHDENIFRHNRIEIKFTNISNDEYFYVRPIELRVDGEQKDWVYMTTKLLEERTSRIKKHLIPYLLNHTRFTGLIMILMMLGFMGWVVLIGFQDDTVRIERMNRLEEQWKDGVYKDPIEVIFEIEKIKSTSGDQFFKQQIPATVSFILMVIILILVVGFVYFLLTYIPAFNFVWGERAEIYNQKVKILKFIFGTVIGGIFLGVLVNFIYDYLK